MTVYELLASTTAAATPAEIAQVEGLMARTMPSQLRELVRVTNGGQLRGEKEIHLPDGSVTGSFELVPLDQMLEASAYGVSSVGWPWCTDGSGNLFVVDASNNVWFWDHDAHEATDLECELLKFDALLVDMSPDSGAGYDSRGVPLLEAVDSGDYSGIGELVEGQGVELLTEALRLASGYATVDVLKTLIDAGADVDGETEPLSPLEMAAGAGRIDLVKYLVSRGAKVDVDGDFVFKAALGGGDREVVEYLRPLRGA